ncbi:MAG: hypothetical protein KDA96_03070 [Planctomycetaceae bacterium]|nr:hypothetical protein [Planctomycetaceae bacterium]
MRNLFTRSVTAVVLALSAVVVMTAKSDVAAAENSFTEAVQAWQSGQLEQAGDLLTRQIDAGSIDPRHFYLRGIVAEQSGRDGSADFHQAALLETEQKNSRLVNTLVSRIQGSVRGQIERHRAAARAQLSSDPERGRQALLYRDAVTALKQGRNEESEKLLDQVIQSQTTDPRPYYLRGVALAKSGDVDQARALFQKGLSLEVNADQVRNVNIALADVQGDIRQMIETEIRMNTGSEALNRQQLVRAALAAEAELREQMIDADIARTNELLAETRANEMARAASAAEAFRLEQEKASAANARIEAIVAATPPSRPITPPMPDPAPEETAPAKSNPFNNPSPFSTTPPAAGSSASTPLDFSWLPPGPEAIVIVRPSGFMNSQFFAPLKNSPIGAGLSQQAQAQGGLDPAKIDWVAGGASDIFSVVEKLITSAQEAPSGPGAAMQIQQDAAAEFASNPNAVVVVRTNVDVTPPEVLGSNQAQAVTHGSQTIHIVSPPPGSPEGTPNTAFCLVDPRNILAGSEISVKAALDRGPATQSLSNFAGYPLDSHFLMAVSSDRLAALSSQIPEPDGNAPPYVADLLAALRGKIGGGFLVVNATNDLTLSVNLVLTDETGTSTAVSALETALGDARQHLSAMQQQAPESLQPSVSSIISSLKATSSGTTVTVQIAIPGTLVSTLTSDPFAMMQLMGPLMGGGMQGGAPGGPRGGFPGGAPPNGFPGGAPPNGFPGGAPPNGFPGGAPPNGFPGAPPNGFPGSGPVE